MLPATGLSKDCPTWPGDDASVASFLKNFGAHISGVAPDIGLALQVCKFTDEAAKKYVAENARSFLSRDGNVRDDVTQFIIIEKSRGDVDASSRTRARHGQPASPSKFDDEPPGDGLPADDAADDDPDELRQLTEAARDNVHAIEFELKQCEEKLSETRASTPMTDTASAGKLATELESIKKKKMELSAQLPAAKSRYLAALERSYEVQSRPPAARALFGASAFSPASPHSRVAQQDVTLQALGGDEPFEASHVRFAERTLRVSPVA
jgi:hypothetical protein